MDTQLLMNLGLTESQAKAYILLVKNGCLTPPELATKAKETRTNSYKIFDRLVELGLATKDESSKKSLYRAGNPVALETLAHKQCDAALQQERRVKDAIPTLLNYFYTFSEQPGIRFFQGKDGIKQIFDDILRTRKDVYLVRSTADNKFFDDEFFEEYRQKRAKAGIHTYAFTPVPGKHSPEVDMQQLFTRTFMGEGVYTASVQWNVYGNKVSLISYGQEAIGIIIESPQIAESFRQILALLQTMLAKDE